MEIRNIRWITPKPTPIERGKSQPYLTMIAWLS